MYKEIGSQAHEDLPAGIIRGGDLIIPCTDPQVIDWAYEYYMLRPWPTRAIEHVTRCITSRILTDNGTHINANIHHILPEIKQVIKAYNKSHPDTPKTIHDFFGNKLFQQLILDSLRVTPATKEVFDKFIKQTKATEEWLMEETKDISQENISSHLRGIFMKKEGESTTIMSLRQINIALHLLMASKKTSPEEKLNILTTLEQFFQEIVNEYFWDGHVEPIARFAIDRIREKRSALA